MKNAIIELIDIYERESIVYSDMGNTLASRLQRLNMMLRSSSKELKRVELKAEIHRLQVDKAEYFAKMDILVGINIDLQNLLANTD